MKHSPLFRVGDLSAALDKAEKEESPVMSKAAPLALMATTDTMRKYESKIKELEAELASKGQAADVDVSVIVPNPWQPRRRFDPEALDELSTSIATVGLIQPIIIRKVEGSNTYQLVAGERRLRAHVIAGIPQIKTIIVSLTNAEMAMIALVENHTREDLTDYETSLGITKAEAEFASKVSMAKALGVSRTTLYRYFAYQAMPKFVLNSLDERPELISADTALNLKATLSEHGDAGVAALNELWDAVLDGELEQTKICAAIEHKLNRSGNKSSPDKLKSHLIRAGKTVGLVSKDAKNLTIKIKTESLDEAGEAKLRAFLAELFPS